MENLFEKLCDIAKPKYKCPSCGGDGIETCHNPDHGFLSGVVNVLRSANESACPCCGHNEHYKVNGGKNKCYECNGTGMVTIEEFNKISDENGFDEEPILIY